MEAHAVLLEDLLAVDEAERDPLEQRAPEVPAAVPEAEADVAAARVGAPDRRALALEVRQEEERVAAGSDGGGLRLEHLEGRAAERPTEPLHRAASKDLAAMAVTIESTPTFVTETYAKMATRLAVVRKRLNRIEGQVQ